MSALRLTFYRENVTVRELNFPAGEKVTDLGPIGDYRWTLKAANGRTIGASTEGYRRRRDAVTNAATMLSVDRASLAYGLDHGGCTLSRYGHAPIRLEVQP